MQDKEKEVDALDNNTQELVKEEKKFEEKISLDSFTPATEVGDKKSVEKEINDARIAFASVHKDVMKKNRIMGIVFLIVMVGALVLAYILPKAINYMFIALFAFFIVVVVLTRLSRKKMDNAVGEYLRAYGSQSDSYVYKNEDIKDVEMAFRAKPDDEVLRSLEFKNDVFAIGSRDVIKGKMGDINFLSSDASYKVGNAKDKKTHRTVFVGKVVQFDSKIKDEGRVLLYMKGCGDAEPDKGRTSRCSPCPLAYRQSPGPRKLLGSRT